MSASRPIEFRGVVLPEAEDEIREAILWYENRRAGLGFEFFGAIEEAMARVVKTPHAWPTWIEDPRYRRTAIHRFPYLLFFEIRNDVVEFVAVAHTSRFPGYWLSRPNEPPDQP